MSRTRAEREDPSFLPELEKLVRRQRPRGFERLLFRTGTLFQSAVRAVLSSRHNYREEGKRPAWLSRVVRNVKLLKLRRARDRSGQLRQLPTADLEPPAREPIPVERAELAELRAAVRALPEDERAVIELEFFEGLKPGEAAERLGVSTKTVRRRHLSAIESLQARMAESETA